MLKLAWRNLMHERTRLVISVSGVALAVLLILVMSGVFAGSEEHAVVYINSQPATLWMMQSGVENMHMSSSILPLGTLEMVKAVPGVQEAVGLLYANAGVDVNGNVIYSYIFAVDHDVPFGGPWNLVEGKSNIEKDEVIIDRDLAARYNLSLGNTVNILGLDLKIVGLSEGTFGIATSISFINKETLARLMGVSVRSESYIMIQAESGTDLTNLSARLKTAIPNTNLLTKAEFAASDQEMISQMGADIIRAMDIISYIVGLLVIGMTIYTATVERSREYGVLKAIGASLGALVRVVFVQAFISTGLGFVVGVGISYTVAALVSRIYPEMLILIRPDELIQQIPVLLGVTVLAALLPLRRIARLDPMMVFRA